MSEWLAKKLNGRKITRGQVYRVYQQHLEMHDPLKETYSVTHISEEDAERMAEATDEKPKPTEEKSP